MAKKVYTTSYIVTILAYSTSGGLYNEIKVKRYFDNIFHMKYYLKNYKTTYGEKFTIIKVLNKEKVLWG